MKVEKITYFKKHRKTVAARLNKAKAAYNDLTIVLNGRLEYTVEEKRYTVSPYDVILIKRGEVRERHVTDDLTDYVALNFVSDESIKLPTFMPGYLTTEINMILPVIESLEEGRTMNSEEASKKLVEAILEILKAKSGNDSYNSITRSIIKYLHDHVHTQIRLEEIGAALRFSPIYCESIFKANIGKSIIDYFIDMKIEIAKKRLIENILTLREISEKLGFGDYNYFARTFKKRTGTTPLEFRKKYT